MQTPCMTRTMSAEQARAAYDLLDQNGVRCWVMGGWGVDALLGRVTREHKDLDLLVLLSDLPRYADVVRRHGFQRKLEWSENQPIDVNAMHFDSAFVDAHPDGREIYVHVIDVDPRGRRHPVARQSMALTSGRRLRDGNDRRSDGALRLPSCSDRHALRLRPSRDAPRRRPPTSSDDLRRPLRSSARADRGYVRMAAARTLPAP